MPRRKSFDTVIRDMVREQVQEAVQGLLGAVGGPTKKPKNGAQTAAARTEGTGETAGVEDSDAERAGSPEDQVGVRVRLMRLNEHWLVRVLAICGASATLALAAPSPYDFAGHWTGTTIVPQHGQSVTYIVNGDFAATGANTFTGMLTVVGAETDCTVNGKRARKVKIRLDCPDGTKPRLKGRLDTATGTITGGVSFVSRHGKPKHGTFTLMKTPG